MNENNNDDWVSTSTSGSVDERNSAEESIDAGLRKIQKLTLEIELLCIEQGKLAEAGEEIGKFISENMPVNDDFPADHEDIFYKWSEQAGRYLAASLQINEIRKVRAKYLDKLMKTVADELTQYETVITRFTERSQ